MQKTRIRMADGSEFTAFFLGDKHKSSEPVTLLNPEADKGFINETNQEGEVFEFKEQMKKLADIQYIDAKYSPTKPSIQSKFRRMLFGKATDEDKWTDS